jgi:hypothetical protein
LSLICPWLRNRCLAINNSSLLASAGMSHVPVAWQRPGWNIHTYIYPILIRYFSPLGRMPHLSLLILFLILIQSCKRAKLNYTIHRKIVMPEHTHIHSLLYRSTSNWRSNSVTGYEQRLEKSYGTAIFYLRQHHVQNNFFVSETLNPHWRRSRYPLVNTNIIYTITWHHIPQDRYLNIILWHENLKYCKVKPYSNTWSVNIIASETHSEYLQLLQIKSAE